MHHKPKNPRPQQGERLPVMGETSQEVGVMPKEYIQNRYFGQYGTEVSGDGHGTRTPLDASAVKVGWSRESEHVEVAVIRDYGNNGDGSGDWHTQLDRNGLNRLIRALRKARDQAYGSDA